jgi:TPR repeat protein
MGIAHPTWIVAFGMALWLISQPSTAGSFEDGVAADTRGDYRAALQIWRELAAEDRPEAVYRLALAYTQGRGVPRDDKEAVIWYDRAAGRGYVPAQLALGRIYDEGKGVRRNQSKAMKWYRRAAQQGDIEAQLALGLIYDTGRGVPQNDWQAAKWYGLAAEKGNAIAQNNLGLIYARGSGLAKDFEQAYLWLSLAAELGHVSAAKSRDAIAANLTAGQIDQARELVRNWLQAKRLERKARCQIAKVEKCDAVDGDLQRDPAGR